jgi:hypothetical protein
MPFAGRLVVRAGKAVSWRRSLMASNQTDKITTEPRPDSQLMIEDLGWPPEYAQAVRARVASFTEDWDDPAMDVYNS